MKKNLFILSFALVALVSIFNACRKTSINVPIAAAPYNLTAAVASPTVINLTWYNRATNEEGYKVESKVNGVWTTIATLAPNSTVYSLTSLTPSTSYTFRVNAFNVTGNSYSNEVTTTTFPIAPTAPTNLIGNVVSDSQIDLTWTDNSSTESAYRVQSKVNGNWILLVTLPANTTSYSLTNLTSNTVYTLRVGAYNIGAETYSNEVSPTTQPSSLMNGLAAYYPFTGNANDASGNNNHGTVHGAVLTNDRFGATNGAYEFNGTTAYIDTQDSPSLSIVGDITLSAWVYDYGASNNYHTIVQKRIGGNWSYSLAYSFVPGPALNEQNKVVTGRRNGGGSGWDYKYSNALISFNRWQHVVVVIKSNKVSFYLDGVNVGNTASHGDQFSISMINQATGLSIGRTFDWASSVTEHMQGKIDEIRIYNRGLTQSEITYLANH